MKGALRELKSRMGGRTAEGEIISVPEASEFLGVHRNTLYKLIREGEIPAFRLITGGRWKFRRRELEQWLEDRTARSIR
jgi:excisionase family DNA binding protein